MRSVVFLLLLLSAGQAYVFQCLDECECDTEDEVIHCHNKQRTTLPMPGAKRLRGFPVLGATYNDLRQLPSEDELLLKFPDLKVIDIERNPRFDCDSLDQYHKIKVISDCDRNVSHVRTVPPVGPPSKSCDVACQAEKHYKKLHEYALQLWEILKKKYNDFEWETAWRDVKTFFEEVVLKLKKALSPSGRTAHPKSLSGEAAFGDEVQAPTAPTVVLDQDE